MDFNEYQKATHETFVDDGRDIGLKICRMVLGIAGESGECAESVKKFLRGDFGVAELKERLKKEMGDSLWYISETCNLLGLSMEQIAKENIDKLRDRKDRGKLKGDGDNR